MQEIDRLRQQLARKASKMIVGGFRPSNDPFASWFGRVKVALPHETWPMHRNRPMTPLCQINCAELPYRPESLADVAFISVFVDLDEFPFTNVDDPADFDPVKTNGDRWLLRAYPSMDGLVRTAEPSKRGIMKPYQRVGTVWKPYALKRVTIKPFPVRWELVEDDYPARASFHDYFGFPYPPPDNFLKLWLEKFPLELLDELPEALPTYGCSKVGGWPDLVQGRIFHRHPAKPEYVFQVAAERQANLYWVDAGVAYFGRGTGDVANEWFAECQFL